MILQQTSISLDAYQEIRNRHYVDNHGCIGKQIHYLIFLDGKSFGEKPIGIISGASPVYQCKPRDDFFGINNNNRMEKLDQIINNVVFRLEYGDPNLASQILAQWRKQIVQDWEKRYHIKPIGFETFVYGRNRNGTCYKADNWKYMGLTKGIARCLRNSKPLLKDGIISRQPTTRKLIFCINNTSYKV